MPYNCNRIESLIEKFLSGNASDEEMKDINTWYHSFSDSKAEVYTRTHTTKDEIGQRIMDRLQISMKKAPGVKIHAQKLYRKRYAFAAAVIVLLGISFLSIIPYLSSNKTADNQAIAAAPIPQKVLPGTDKAYLTLADGSIVLLDSSQQGNIGKQGAVEIKKLANGQIAYVMNGKTLTENDAAFYNTITTPRGGQYKVVLSDGTAVWLNAASSIRFPVLFAGEERSVNITGEAYFEVAKIKGKAFVVEAGNTKVEVLGTHFNVNAYSDESTVKTTLLEGSVRIDNTNDNSISTHLVPGEQAQMNKEGKTTVVTHADTEETLAWKNGIFVFKSTELSTILRQIGRWYDVEIEQRGNANINFTGQLPRNEEVTDVLKMLALTGEVKFALTGRKIIVTRK